MAKKKWGLIVLGIVIFVVIVCVGAVGIVGFLTYRQMDVHTTTTASPDEEFAKALAPFEGQAPFIDLPARRGEGTPVVHREQEGKEPIPLSTLHILAWDPGEKKLVRLSLPFWILRLGGNRPIRMNSGQGFLDANVRLDVTVEEIERHGPGLILNYTAPRGERVVVWAQ
jgi:hypothetical protein